MRVIAGSARGRPLIGPPGPQTRPTSDKVKGALFSMLESLLVARRPGAGAATTAGEPGTPELWAGLPILDLYAGTGALGIEALSRGAAWCDFVESHAAARRTIERNLTATGLAGRARVIGRSVERVVRGDARDLLHRPYAVVLADPPYAEMGVGAILAALGQDGFLEPAALVAVEHSRRVSLAADYPTPTGALQEVRQRRHGDTILSIYRLIASIASIASNEDEGEGNGRDGDLPGEL